MSLTHPDWALVNTLVREGTLTDEQLGRYFRSYVRESIHGGFDGFARRDMTGVRRLLVDVVAFAKAANDDEGLS